MSKPILIFLRSRRDCWKVAVLANASTTVLPPNKG